MIIGEILETFRNCEFQEVQVIFYMKPIHMHCNTIKFQDTLGYCVKFPKLTLGIPQRTIGKTLKTFTS